jgi:hypothetical protein
VTGWARLHCGFSRRDVPQRIPVNKMCPQECGHGTQKCVRHARDTTSVERRDGANTRVCRIATRDEACW